jgi:hypothetical protein
MYSGLMLTIYWELPMALPIANRPLTADLVIAMLNNSDSEAVTLPPVILEDLSTSEEGIKALQRLSYVTFGGGEALTRDFFLVDQPLILITL